MEIILCWLKMDFQDFSFMSLLLYIIRKGKMMLHAAPSPPGNHPKVRLYMLAETNQRWHSGCGLPGIIHQYMDSKGLYKVNRATQGLAAIQG